jgi:hypothetical protein
MGRNPGCAARRFEPDPDVVALVEKHGASRVGLAYALDADAMRRYLAGVSQRTTRWWIEINRDAVERELRQGPARIGAEAVREGA